MEKFSIVPVVDKATNRYEIAGFDDIREKVSDYVRNECLRGFVIMGEQDLRVLKAKRTEIRKVSEALKDSRLSINKLVLGQINDQLKELEKLLNKADSELKQAKDEWDESHKEPEPTCFTLKVDTLDETAFKKVADYARKKGCIVTEVNK